MRRVYHTWLCAVVLLVCTSGAAEKSATTFITMATTTSTDNSGLLKVLLPAFTQKSGIAVHVIAVGTGKALKLGENGDVDLVLVHAREAELKFVKDGFGVNRRDVMYNDFVIVGPASDPAKIAGTQKAANALLKIAQAQAPFISRGDESGTHSKEKELWAAINVVPSGSWYIQAGQGMEAVLFMAQEKLAYTMTDRGTFIALENKLDLHILCKGDSVLYNPYGVIAVNPAKFPSVKYKQAMLFIDWIVSKEGQARIAGFSINGKQLFFPDAHN